MIRGRKLKQSITVAAFSLILLISASNFLPNGLKTAYARPHFGAVGDWGCSDEDPDHTGNTERTVKNIVDHKAPRTLSLGDMSYKSSPTCWYNIVKPLDGDADPSIPKHIQITIGNHDDDSSSKLSSYKDHFNLDHLYYSFNKDYVHVVVMNSEDPNRTNKEGNQYKFVKSDLEKAHNNPAIKWIIVFVHQPFFSSPNRVSEGDKSLTQAYWPLFDTNEVDVVLAGHVHNYQRTFPVKFNSANPLNPTRTTTIPCDYTNPTGRIFAIVGVGGDSFHPLEGKANFVSVQQDKKFGQLDISFSDDGNTLTGKFFSNDGGTASQCGTSSITFDRFTIKKTFGTTTISTISIEGSDENNGEPHHSFVLVEDPFT